MILALQEMNWQLILSVLVVSAVIAYVGDRIGMRIGKKRISLFGLRPRQTSSIITAATGLLIALGTLAVLATASDSVRTALFSMKYVQRQITSLTGSLQESREEFADVERQLFESQSSLLTKQQELFDIEKRLEAAQLELAQERERLQQAESDKTLLEAETKALKSNRAELESVVAGLKTEAERLRQGLDDVREGHIIVFAGELLSQVPIPSGSRRHEVEILIAEARNRARHFVGLRFGGAVENVQIGLSASAESYLLETLTASPHRQVLRFLSGANALGGEAISVDPRVYVSDRVYRAGQVLIERKVAANRDRQEAEEELYALLRQVNALAVSDGVLPDPLHKTIGTLTATEFFEAIESLSNRPVEARVTIIVDEETYSEGPVTVRIAIEDSP